MSIDGNEFDKYTMRLFEIQNPRLYLCTDEEQLIGGIVRLQGTIYPLGAAIEGKVEQRRPDDGLPREKSLYLHTNPSSDVLYSYEIVPLGHVDRNHMGWLRKLADVDPMQHGIIDQFACGYWSGTRYAEAQNEPWEYRALAVRIIERVGGAARS
ncbi:hypothetical protein [Beijerinckia sp. L45]|uniref:hypothetical protein n=1 Tax=Beijerinckia sp. L45 TaxID=1641855 RepID=UPI00131EC788|nr:hypothetical protein [Beijerinckia sp. L45]